MPKLIDGHTHIFNVGFLPVEGILRSRKVPDSLARHVTNALLVLLERSRTAALADDTDQFMSMLQAELSGPSTVDPQFMNDDWFSRYADAIPDSKLPELRKALPPSMLDDISDEVRNGLLPDKVGFGDDDADVRRRLEALFRHVDQIAGPIETGEAAGFLGLDVMGLLKWLSMLVQHESRIVAAFSRAWNDAGDFIAQVHLMMDMERHYSLYGGRPPEYAFATEQLSRMQAVVSAAPIRLIGMAAFDPFRSNGLDIAKDAINRGFAGIKFYPPNGYKPIDNLSGDICNGPSAQDVNYHNLKFFEWCVDKDIPVFAHCTLEGMESRPHVTGKFSHPDHWEKVLKTPGLEKLRLCLGHAGGQDGWMAKFDADGVKTWNDSCARKVFELCCNFDNVYGDFGYFDHLLDGDGERFADRLEWAFTQDARFAAKCCYGTDWHLMTIRKHARDYPRLFRAALEKSNVIKPHIDNFMFRNVLRFLRLPELLSA